MPEVVEKLTGQCRRESNYKLVVAASVVEGDHVL